MAVLKPYKDTDYYIWKYVPSLPAAAVFIALFGLLTIAYALRVRLTRTWFCIPFVLGCAGEALGYGFRIMAVDKTDQLAPYIQQSTFILISPALFAASIYMTLGRVIRSVHAEQYSIIRVTRLTKLFVWLDVFAFSVQGGGAGFFGTHNDNLMKIGEDIILAGLAIQLISFGLFFASAIVFEKRINANPTPTSLTTKIPWRQMLRMLYAVSVLILLRSAFRIVEYVQGSNGYSLRHEWTLYVFDSVPMFVVALVFLIWFPSRLVKKNTEGEEDCGELQLTARSPEPPALK